MSTPPLWCEARCAFMDQNEEGFGENRCHETAPGAFGALSARQIARRGGWVVRDGEWCCPACQRVLAAQSTIQSRGDDRA